jgi:pimeloyl-ACP methyl ester carboxylesterase
MARQGAWPLPEGIKSVEVNRYPMAYRESGAGAPLILVHGSLNDYRYWDSQVPVFAQQYRVFAVSLRHYFPEPWDGQGEGFSIRQHADDVVEFIRKLDLGSVHLLGHSRGGAVALNVAADHPRVIRTLVLVDPSGLEMLLPDTPESCAMAVEGRKLRERLATDLANGDREAGVKAYVEAITVPGRWDKLDPDKKSILFDNVATAIRPEMSPSLSDEAVRKFKFPLLMLTGEKSPKRYGEMLRAMRDCLPDGLGETVVIGNASHGMNRENPRDFDAAVLRFLSGR